MVILAVTDFRTNAQHIQNNTSMHGLDVMNVWCVSCVKTESYSPKNNNKKKKKRIVSSGKE